MTKSDLIREIRRLAQAVTGQLQQRRREIAGVGSVAELEFMQQELSTLAAKLEAGEWPPAERRWLASARMVTDTWPPDNQLGESICRVAYLYRHDVDDDSAGAAG